MADQREITLYPGDATPKDIVLRELPVATPSAGTTVFLYQGDATPKDIILGDPTVVRAVGGSTDHPATIAVTLEGISVSVSGTVGHTGTIAATLDGIAVSAAGTVGHPGTIAVTLDGIAVTSAGTVGHPTTIAITLADIAAEAFGTVGHDATIEVTLDGITVEINGTSSGTVAGGAQPIGGDFWLQGVEEKPLPQKVVKIIKRVAKAEAPQIEFKLAPLKKAFQAANYPFKSDYAEVYRQAFYDEMSRLHRQLEEDDEDVLALLL